MATPIVITEEIWMNSHLSIARHYGQIKAFGAIFVIVNKHRITLLELSNPHSKNYVGNEATKAIPPGEPADLVHIDWLPIYKALGRDKTIELVRQDVSLKDAKAMVAKSKQKNV